MCGISGIFDWNSLKNAEKVASIMKDSQDHRGPDFNSTYRDDNIIISHNRLSIIDLDPQSNQPMYSHTKDLVLSYNGELYNYMALKSELKSDYPFKTQSDTEVIIASYLKWGMRMLDRFDGMFAFALWDKAKKQLFLARDRMGVKPLYFMEYDKSILFSSSCNAIIKAVSKKTFRLNKNSIQEYLNFGTVYTPSTIIDKVKAVERSHYIHISSESFDQFKYWEPKIQNTVNQLQYKQVTKKINQLLLQSVEKRLIADVPVGVFLSGGIDSSTIVAIASKVAKNKINTYSVTYDDKSFDESIYSRQIAELYSTNHKEIKVDPNTLLHNIDDYIKQMDHPTVDGLNSYIISKAVSNENIKVAISGAGSDELFLGYPFYKLASRFEENQWVQSFPPFLKKIAGHFIKQIYTNHKGEKMASILNQKFLKLDYYYPFFRKMNSNKELNLLCPNLNFNSSYYAFDWYQQNIGQKSMWPFYSKLSLLEMECYLQNVLLRDADQMGMANSIEIRVPFLDHQLIEFVLSVPDRYKIGAHQKQLLLDSVSGWIPNEIIDRKKMGFVLPIEKWMKNELSTFCKNALMGLDKFHEFDLRYVLKMWDQFLAGDGRIQWVQIWSLVILGSWSSIHNINQYNA